MHVDLHLDKDEFSKLHNFICRVSNMADRLEDIGHAEEGEKLAKEVEAIREMLKPAYDADSAKFDELHAHYREEGDGFDAQTTWSVYEVENLRAKHDYPGVKTITHSSHWGETTPVVDIQGDTWADLYIAADQAIRLSGDLHHSFIEGFVREGETLKLLTGS